MELHQESTDGANFISGHGPGWLEINGKRHATALFVGNDFCHVVDAAPATLDTLDDNLLEQIIAAAPELVLFGAGASFALAPRQLVERLAACGIGAESMDSVAAARTFNVLLGEGRKVVAFLLPPG